VAEPFQENWFPPVLGGDTEWGLLETAKLRILRHSGRKEEADRLAAGLLGSLRAAERKDGMKCKYDSAPSSPLRYASLAANEGMKEEAVAALRHAMHCGDLPFAFWPSLPWFRSLEGYAPYDALLQERERRVVEIRAELLRLEASAVGPVKPPGKADTAQAILAK
jgi:hypothetical protein